MKKNFRLVLALVLSIMMVLGSMSAMAAGEETSSNGYGAVNAHTITITNTDQNVTHSYEAYKVFNGNLDAVEDVLSDITWAAGVKSTDLLAALQASTDAELKAKATDLTDDNGTTKDVLGKALNVGDNIFTNASTAGDVAKILGTFDSTNELTQSAGRIDAVATIIAANLGTKAADFGVDPADNTGKTYTANVSGDGYYFILDTTSDLTNDTTKGSDTLSKYLLAVIKDTTIVAKDTGITPDKKIQDATGDGSERAADPQTLVAADSSAIGDTVTFEVNIKVPNTIKYEDHFVFHMNDQLDNGLTFTGIKSIKIGNNVTLVDSKSVTGTKDTTGETGYYTLQIGTAGNNKTAAENLATPDSYYYTADGFDPVNYTGGQAIKVIFENFKEVAEFDRDSSTDGDQNLIGQDIEIVYTAVLNDDATYTTTANENEVRFDYSNNPNNDYHGDEFGPNDPKGTTPESKTRTYTTAIKVYKVDENGTALAGAEFTLTGNALNRTVITGDKFELTSYQAKDNETVDTTTKYYKLKDGSFTKTPPTTANINTTQYEKNASDGYDEYYKVSYSYSDVSTQQVTLVVTSDASGVIEFVGLREGTYTLEETHSPDGYNKINGVDNFTIAWSDPKAEGATSPAKDQGGFTLTEDSASTNKAFGLAWDSTDQAFIVTIENNKGVELPSTGGIGTTIFYVAGSILVLAAAILLITKRRMGAND